MPMRPPAEVFVPRYDRLVPRMMPTFMCSSKDALIAWFTAEFAAANAIIDALCTHLTQLEGGAVGVGSEYEFVFDAIHCRRREWISVINMQKYHPIADVMIELNKVASRKSWDRFLNLQEEEGDEVTQFREEINGFADVSYSEKEANSELCVSEKEMYSEPCVPEKEMDSELCLPEKETNSELCVPEKEIVSENENDGDGEVVDEDTAKDDSPENEITDTGSQEVQQSSLKNTKIFSNHASCEARLAQIKIVNGYIAKDSVRGQMVNVVNGLKLYEDVFTHNELSKLNDLVNDLRVAGRNGELTGETFSLYNQRIKGSKRELIQFGVPVFEQIQPSKSQRSDIEPIPSLLEDIIEHLIQWHIISESRRPNSCIINFFDEGEYSQPYLKPPHLDQPISILLLSESKMAFGHNLVNDNEGNYTGPLVLSLKEGSILVMAGNSAEKGRHVMCSSPNKRVSIILIKTRTQTQHSSESVPSPTTAMNVSHLVNQHPHSTSTGAVSGYQPMGAIQKLEALSPMVMLTPLQPVMFSPVQPVVMSTRGMSCDGTGVFLPCTVRSRRPAKRLPPRAQRGRLLAMSLSAETCKTEFTSDPNITEILR